MLEDSRNNGNMGLPRETCAQCGRQGRPGNCFKGLVQDRAGRCGSCGYPYRGIEKEKETSHAL